MPAQRTFTSVTTTGSPEKGGTLAAWKVAAMHPPIRVPWKGGPTIRADVTRPDGANVTLTLPPPTGSSACLQLAAAAAALASAARAAARSNGPPPGGGGAGAAAGAGCAGGRATGGGVSLGARGGSATAVQSGRRSVTDRAEAAADPTPTGPGEEDGAGAARGGAAIAGLRGSS